jgi:tetratricopeptide (TPR) repeat protein
MIYFIFHCKRLSICLKWQLISVSILLSFFSQAQVPVASNHSTYALVVGISRYQSIAIPALRFADRDAQTFATFLQSSAGGNVPPENITMLLNENATFTAIYDAMYQLLDRAEKNDKVYLYFSGHGDVETKTVLNLGYLLGYNTPPNNYINHAVRLEDINYFANTLSARNVTVIIITDACRSGKLAGDGIGGRRLIGENLRKALSNEVRLASCGPDELSAENEAWGGGRGIFSYYLLLGMQGLALKPDDKGVSAEGVKEYLRIAFEKDEVLHNNQHRQTPVIEGNTSIILSTPGKPDIEEATQRQRDDSSLPAGLQRFFSLKSVPLQPVEFIVSQIKRFGILNILDFQDAMKQPVKELPFQILRKIEEKLDSTDEEIVQTLAIRLKSYPDELDRFNERMAAVIQDYGHEMIAAYLTGDQAELEKRSYYNVLQGEFDKYVNMYSLALKLIPADHFLYKSLRVDREYFRGVLWRMKTYLKDNNKAYLDSAYQILQAANRLEPYAPYIHNELANVYRRLGLPDSAIYHYNYAAELAPTWAVPLSNLAGVYNSRKEISNARYALKKAKSLQPEFFNLIMNEGLTEELSGNWLRAEELYLNGQKKNDLHYFPYESLGKVYAATMRFREADSSFFEAEKRKFGFNVPDADGDGVTDMFDIEAGKIMDDRIPGTITCTFPPLAANEKDAILLCMAGFLSGNDSLAEGFYRRAVVSGINSFLPNHHYGKLLYNKGKLTEAEAFLVKAKVNFIDSLAFEAFSDSLALRSKALSFSCYKYYLGLLYYDWREDEFMLGDIYKRLGYIEDAERIYEQLIEKDNTGDFPIAHYLLSNMLTEKGRYEASEQAWLRYKSVVERAISCGKPQIYSEHYYWLYAGMGTYELENFYNNMLERFPNSPAWHFKAGTFWYKKIMKNLDEYINNFQPGIDDIDMLPSSPSVKSHSLAFGPAPGLTGNLYFSQPLSSLYKKTINALTRLTQLATEDEQFISACVMLAHLYAAADFHETAAQWYARAAEAEPTDASIRRNLAINLMSAGFRYNAYNSYFILFNKGQLLAADFLLYSELAMLSGNFDDAKSVLNQSDFLIPEGVNEIGFLYAKLYFISRDIDNAKVAFSNNVSGLTEAERAYALASIYAANSNTSKAMQWLRVSLEKGFSFGYLLRNDPVWNNMRDVKWQKLVDKNAAQYLVYISWNQ